MWNRKEAKETAKKYLKNNYWPSFFMGLVLYFSGSSLSSSLISFESKKETTKESWGTFADLINFPYFKYFLIGGLFIGLAFILLRIFIGYTFEVGAIRFFIKNISVGATEYGLKEYFEKEKMKNIIKTMILRDVYNTLWFFALIIPGIIKFYQYRMIPFVLADNPHLEPERVFELSKKMTDGEKFNLFVTDFSFILWYILGSILIIGNLFVNPYYVSTCTNIYISSRNYLIRINEAYKSEFNLKENKNPEDSLESSEL